MPRRAAALLAAALAAAAIAAAHGYGVQPYDFRAEIESPALSGGDGCQADVLSHFTELVAAPSERGAFHDGFSRGVRLAWVCSTMRVRRPCASGVCDKSACFRSLLRGEGSSCDFTDDDYLGFAAVESSVERRFHREMTQRQLRLAEDARAALADVAAGQDEVLRGQAEMGARQAQVLLQLQRIERLAARIDGLAERVAYLVEFLHRLEARAGVFLDTLSSDTVVLAVESLALTSALVAGRFRWGLGLAVSRALAYAWLVRGLGLGVVRATLAHAVCRASVLYALRAAGAALAAARPRDLVLEAARVPLPDPPRSRTRQRRRPRLRWLVVGRPAQSRPEPARPRAE